jgi:energy-coupling factor transporter transmembrane protein EcfT
MIGWDLLDLIVIVVVVLISMMMSEGICVIALMMLMALLVAILTAVGLKNSLRMMWMIGVSVVVMGSYGTIVNTFAQRQYWNENPYHGEKSNRKHTHF